jgi:hypothetical protein
MSAYVRWPLGGESLAEVEDAHELMQFVESILESRRARPMNSAELADLGEALDFAAESLAWTEDGDADLAAEDLASAKDAIERYYGRRR